MTSVIRRYDQQPAQTRYLIALQSFNPDLSANVYNQYMLSDISGTAFAVPYYTFGPSELIADVSFGTINATPFALSQNDLYLTTGRSLHVFNTLGPNAVKLCTFREIVKQFDFTTEGINITGGNVAYVKTWSAYSCLRAGPPAGTPQVFVARTG
jgi:hypothetical protein